ncbi:MAG: hypothetical protein PHG04_03225 [Candidatus Nanoarchaeia archaeon]|nr:hypothetical protein [Candidatus Nanoarchaeia archaeon]MDD5054363.1 hypothetical protein [Candidatus Nanoarchaeia archaeon]
MNIKETLADYAKCILMTEQVQLGEHQESISSIISKYAFNVLQNYDKEKNCFEGITQYFIGTCQNEEIKSKLNDYFSKQEQVFKNLGENECFIMAFSGLVNAIQESAQHSAEEIAELAEQTITRRQETLVHYAVLSEVIECAKKSGIPDKTAKINDFITSQVMDLTDALLK